ncbi:hypothetical protein Saga11_19480 [Bacillus safensis]|nr:hypothetical protein Saga11_19480 [Bacillus safensis]
MKLLVTGATGQLGSLVVQHLLTKVPAQQIAVSVRDPQKAVHLKEAGVDVRRGDFTQPDTLTSAFQGIDRLLIISTADGDRVQQHTAAYSGHRSGKSSKCGVYCLYKCCQCKRESACPCK